MTVTGSGEVEVEPDTAIADVGVEARGVDAERALAEAGLCLDRMRRGPARRRVDDLSMRTTQSSTWTDGSATGSSRAWPGSGCG